MALPDPGRLHVTAEQPNPSGPGPGYSVRLPSIPRHIQSAFGVVTSQHVGEHQVCFHFCGKRPVAAAFNLAANFRLCF